MQFYIVSGESYRRTGRGRHEALASTEILKKEGGTSWQTAASLPSGRWGFSGVSLPNGHFMVLGNDVAFSPLIMEDPYSGKVLFCDHPC